MWILFVDYVFFLDFVDKVNMKYDVFRYILILFMNIMSLDMCIVGLMI